MQAPLPKVHGVRAASLARACPAAAGLLLGLFASAASAQTDVVGEVTDLARFARWPDEAGYGLTLRLCLRDDDPAFGLFTAAEGVKIQGRPISVHSVTPDGFAAAPCHIAFFSAGMADERILAALNGLPVLTVSTERGFARRGGFVELVNDRGRTVIVIDHDAAGRRPLRLTAPLLDLAEDARS